MEEDEAVKVGVKGLEEARFVQGVVIFDEGGNFHHRADAVFDDGAEWVGGGTFGEREFRVAVGHAFGTDQY